MDDILTLKDLNDDSVLYLLRFLHFEDVIALSETCSLFFSLTHRSLKLHNPPKNEPQIASSIPYLEWVTSHRYFKLSASLFTEAMYFGNIQILRYLQRKKCPIEIGAWAAAIDIRDVYILKFLLRTSGRSNYEKKSQEWTIQDIFYILSKCLPSDDVEILKIVLSYVSDKGPWRTPVCEAVKRLLFEWACLQGKYNIAVFFLEGEEDDRVFASPYILLDCVKGGNVDLVSYVVDKYIFDLSYNLYGISPSSAVLTTAASEAGNLDVLVWLREHNYSWDPTAIMTRALEDNRLDIYNYVSNTGF